MRFIRSAFLFILLAAGNGIGQQFYKSGALEYFNRGQYQAAVDTLVKWADAYTSERGIAYYYMGECYYNMGLEANVPSEAARRFREGLDYLNRANQQTDLRTLYPEKSDEARYKWAWCSFRLAELEADPLVSLERARSGFTDVSSSRDDSLSIHSLTMVGEVNLRMAAWKRIQMHLSANVGQAGELAQEAVDHLKNAENAFRRVAASNRASVYLRTCARLKMGDVLIERGRVYQRMPDNLFARVRDAEKKATQAETSAEAFLRVDYASLLNAMDRQMRNTLEPIAVYGRSVHFLDLYLLTGEDRYKQRLNSSLDSLRWDEFREEKAFLQASRDYTTPIDNESFLRLTDARTSFYAQAAGTNPEAWYWMGWAQFIANETESERSFDRFLRESASLASDPRMSVLREDARYRMLLLSFDKNAANLNTLAGLRNAIEAFDPRVQFIQEQKRLLLQLVRVGLGESIWRQILRAPTTEDKLKDAFILIRNMLIRATRVTGQERVPYLLYLDKLFQITEERRSLETSFYRGLSMFLRAEIQESAQDKRQFYITAADMLKGSEGNYRYEGMYVQARSYFAAAKHESNSDRMNRVYERAKPIFVQLINDAQSLRSVYYLGEIFRNQGNDHAARRCYEIVVQKTEGKSEGAFWYNNATAGIQSCGSSGNAASLNGIRIENVTFPENVPMVDGVKVSLERFADPEYIRRQYWEEGVNFLLKFGKSMRTLYPSAFRLQASRYGRYAFDAVTANIWERIGAIASGLQIRVVTKDGDTGGVTVSLDGAPIQKDENGFYNKASLPMSQAVKIRVEGDGYYPYVCEYSFLRPGLEKLVIPLSRRILFDNQGTGVEAGVDTVVFSKRLDANIVMHSEGATLPQTSFLYKDFQSDVVYRDFVYSKWLDGYLVVHSGMENLLLYRNDAMVSKEGEFPLIFPEEIERLMSPEGIAVDSRGNIYIVDWGNHRISVFQKDGSFVRSFGGFGTNNPADAGKTVQFMFPTRIAIAEDSEGLDVEGEKIYESPHIFVADRNGIHLMDQNGIYLETVVSSGNEKGWLYGLAVRGYGPGLRLYVVDRRTGRIGRFGGRSTGGG